MNRCAVLILFFTTTIIRNEARNLPSFIQKCKRNYPEVNECIKQRIDEMLPRLEKGDVPELKIPNINPLKISQVHVETASPNNQVFKVTFSDVEVYGVNKLNVLELDVDLYTKHKLALKFLIPVLYINMLYNFKGKILVLELDSSGTGNINVTNINVDVEINSGFETRNGKEYVTLDSNKLKLNVQHDNPRVYFDKLFNGNEELTVETNRLLNENIVDFDKDTRPLIQKAVGHFVAGIIVRVFHDYSVDELFL